MVLGVGVGWMEKEFRALGVDPRHRGATTDATLAFLHACFAGDEVEANGQTFLFRPRPQRPPIIVGGAPPHAIRHAVRFGEGWMPTGAHAQVLEDPESAASQLLMGLRGMCVAEAEFGVADAPPRAQRDAHVRRVVRLFLDGARPRG